MAASTKQEIHVKTLSTSHVTLYPTRALITRSIGNIDLQPGTNEIEIYGITPTADEHSIKVDGTGAASITDMAVNLVPNKESFEDVYPDDSDSDLSESDDENSDSDQDSEPDEIRALRKKIKSQTLHLERLRESAQVAEKALDLFNDYLKKVDAKRMAMGNAQELIDSYCERRLAKHDELTENIQEQTSLEKEIRRMERELLTATKETRAQKAKADKEAAKTKAKKQREKDEKARAAQRIREERLKFWPKKVYQVVIHLDASVDTPTTSRRSSVSSATAAYQESPQKQNPEQGRPVWLTLSYVTSDARWSPRYDMTFMTPNKTGSIVYRAEYENATSETWKDAKVSLSTSQASFRGLDDEVPFMHPWRLGLAKTLFGYDGDVPGITSNEEQIHKGKQLEKVTNTAFKRSELFGASNDGPNLFKVKAKRREARTSTQHNDDKSALLNAYTQHYTPERSTRGAPPGGGLFGRSSNNQTSLFASLPAQSRSFASAARAPVDGGNQRERLSENPFNPVASEEADALNNAANVGAAPPFIEFEDSAWEDHGLTQTYDLPGVRTLEPSSLTRRYKIATLPFNNLVLTSISVPKLRAASFLRARFRNPSSSITLLKGTAGLTLDGAFLGNTTLPRISPGELITLPLGVDPAVQVSYAKPTVKRSTQGMFSKESAQVFTRSIILTNSKPVAAELLVLDQIPVSEEERLRIEVLQPRGLAREGDTVSAGVNAKQGKTEGEKWGKAKATLKKDGEVAWTVNLEKGGACRLNLEYEVKAPSSENLVSK